jgi:hypothetical protein
MAGGEQKPFLSVASTLIIGVYPYPIAVSRRVELLLPDDLLQIAVLDNVIGAMLGLAVGCDDG